MHYRTSFWKLALGGVIAGAALYFFPFLLPALAFVFLAGLLFRLFFGFGYWRGYHHRAYAMHWANMTEEQRQAMRAKFRYGCCGPWDTAEAAKTPTDQPNT